MKLCSACLLGIKCRYNGKGKPNKKLVALAKKELLIPVCPEQLGGQPTPRPNAEIKNGNGKDVLKRKAKVYEDNGQDVTRYFINGAKEVLKIAKLYNVKVAILKQKSPSCGSGQIYDGTFSKNLISGDGVTSALLKKKGIKIISEEEI